MTEAKEPVTTTLLSVGMVRAAVRMLVVPCIAGMRRSFSVSCTLMVRGEAIWARCVTSFMAVSKAPGVMRSGTWRMVRRFEAMAWEKWEVSCEAEAAERTVARS